MTNINQTQKKIRPCNDCGVHASLTRAAFCPISGCAFLIGLLLLSTGGEAHTLIASACRGTNLYSIGGPTIFVSNAIHGGAIVSDISVRPVGIRWVRDRAAPASGYALSYQVDRQTALYISPTDGGSVIVSTAVLKSGYHELSVGLIAYGRVTQRRSFCLRV